MSKQGVTVIGLGPMGTAMAETFLSAGRAVTVWNRSTAKADPLVRRGAARAATVEEALAANELVVLSLTDYDALYAVLEPAAHALRGRVVANLSSDTPERARDVAAWVERHGAVHLTGGVQVPPSGIGNPESATYYSGPREAFETHRETLGLLTATDYRGTDPGLAQLYYQLGMNIFWTTMLSWLQTLAVARANGISPSDFLPSATSVTASIPGFLAFYTPRLDAGEHPGDVDKLAMGAASVEHVLHTTEAGGTDAALPKAVLEVFQRGLLAGRADDSFTSLLEVLAARR